MIFSSLDFLVRFLPIFLIIYYLIPRNITYGTTLKNFVLLAGSLFFYAYGEPVFVFLMIASIVINYFMAKGLDYYNSKPRGKNKRKAILIGSVIFNLGMLFFFKYINFLIINIDVLLKQFNIPVIPTLKLSLPIGISFYTFQILSYVIDVYYERYMAETNLLTLGTYISMFPQLIAGPIVRYTEVRDKLENREFSSAAFDRGLKLFIFGLAGKVIIANNIGTLWTDIERVGYENISTPYAWLGAAAYSFQIYYDFYGYSLMAIGLGMMLGFKLPQNFKDPYASRSATEFWQRWHITLGSWFREYLYIPLGGNRKGTFKKYRNLFAVWLFTGLWHGADWNFIIWGLGFFVIISFEKAFLKKYLDKYKILSHLYMFFLIPVSWVVFGITNINKLGVYLSRMFPIFNTSYDSNINVNDFIMHGKDYLPFFLIAIFFCIPKVNAYVLKLRRNWLGTFIGFILFIACLYYLSLGLDNPFLYFRF